MATSHNISSAAALQFFVACKMRERQPWYDEDLSWLQQEIAKTFGYLILDWTRPFARETNRGVIELYKRHCYAVRWPAIVLRAHQQTCSITVDLDSMQRDRAVEMGGMTPAESAAIEELMQPYRKELRGSPIIRRWGSSLTNARMSSVHTTAKNLFAKARQYSARQSLDLRRPDPASLP
jgi:hypothetical protein